MIPQSKIKGLTSPQLKQKKKSISKVGSTKKKLKKKETNLENDCLSIKPAESKNDIALVFENIVKPGRLELTLPIRTVSEANNFDPWQKKHKRHKAQKKTVFFGLLNLKRYINLPCKISLIRYAPKTICRFDNLPMSFKWILDAICEAITGDYRPGLADDAIADDIEVIYDQVISKTYAVKIIIDFNP